MKDKSLLLLRGLPGSGKTTLAGTLASAGKYPVFSVDDYFTDENGTYHFVFSENHLAYKSCEERTRAEMLRRTELIIVDNTFTLEWEMKPYESLSQEFGYTLHVVTVENRHDGKNIHGIEDDQVARMREKYRIVL